MRVRGRVCTVPVHVRFFLSQPCPFRHDESIRASIPRPAVCPDWSDFVCNSSSCTFLHSLPRPPPRGALIKASIQKRGAVAVFWDLRWCPVPPGVWKYGSAMAFSAYLRRREVLFTAPGFSYNLFAVVPPAPDDPGSRSPSRDVPRGRPGSPDRLPPSSSAQAAVDAAALRQQLFAARATIVQAAEESSSASSGHEKVGLGLCWVCVGSVLVLGLWLLSFSPCSLESPDLRSSRSGTGW